MLLQYFESTLGLSAGESAVFVNGIQVDVDVSDVFTLVELMRTESNVMAGLHSLAQQYQFNAALTHRLMKLDLSQSETMYAVDIRDPTVIVRPPSTLHIIIIIVINSIKIVEPCSRLSTARG